MNISDLMFSPQDFPAIDVMNYCQEQATRLNDIKLILGALAIAVIVILGAFYIRLKKEN